MVSLMGIGVAILVIAVMLPMFNCSDGNATCLVIRVLGGVFLWIM